MLQACWQEAGLPIAEAVDALADMGARVRVRQLAAAAARTGMNGVPHFELHGAGGNVVLQGGQAPATILAALKKVAG